ncbi:flagellar biosynthesis anti-sigma factor FlgM [Bacillus sp. SM2101]|uniref:flagellar biosynthesis anti-sigma factor FlgM n=1 Tax=Bacillus sp. SM2101 TaxID=2805366 RepID=UPI001BDE1DF1|nr:flagellar biosynthesis anti-sigma factor FlgM [Bacillus sp. SM2101]
MKINQFKPNGLYAYKQQTNQYKNNIDKHTKSDRIEISSAAKELQETSQVEIDRQQKVETLKQQVQNGTYTINREQVAKGLYQFYTKQ